MSPAKVQRQQRWKLIITIVTLAFLALLIYGVRGQIADTIENLGKVNGWALFLMLPLQALNYDTYTRMYRYILALLDEKIEYISMFGVQLELNFVNHILPSGGVSGFSYFGVRMRDYDIPAGKSTLVQFMRFILIFISFQALLVLGLIMLAFSGRVNNFVILITASLLTLLVVGTFVMAYILGSKERVRSSSVYITRVINKFINIFRRQHPETISLESVSRVFTDLQENYQIIRRDYGQLRAPLIYAFVANITEILTLYVVYIAFGLWVNPGAIILAYAVANFAGLISILPAGVGIYEALMTAVLAATGIPAGVSIPVTVMYRIISMTIQLVPGYILYYRHLHQKPKPLPQ
jgi:uncharacterized protein (TIRG00374 family)